jgi:uncharacterized protein YhfF
VRSELPVIEFAFPGALRNSLIAAIDSGAKSSTSSLMREYEIGGEALPRSVIEALSLIRMGKDASSSKPPVSRSSGCAMFRWSYALDEGELYASVAEWREGHESFWSSAAIRASLGARY